MTPILITHYIDLGGFSWLWFFGLCRLGLSDGELAVVHLGLVHVLLELVEI